MANRKRRIAKGAGVDVADVSSDQAVSGNAKDDETTSAHGQIGLHAQRHAKHDGRQEIEFPSCGE